MGQICAGSCAEASFPLLHSASPASLRFNVPLRPFAVHTIFLSPMFLSELFLLTFISAFSFRHFSFSRAPPQGTMRHHATMFHRNRPRGDHVRYVRRRAGENSDHPHEPSAGIH